MGAETKYNWTDNPTESGVAVCDTDVLNDCLMHLKYENIGLNKITNCLLEVPQRIKYDLTDGTLTIKAGSVVIVPYGTEDLTTQYPVGSTFLNSNFKVVDTQFEDGKFFVWAEVQSDIVSNTSGSTTEEVQFMCVSLTLNTTGWQKNTESGTSATTSKTYTLYYNTNTNLIGITKNTTTPNYTDEVFSFVFLAVTNSTSNSWKSVNQVFNGMGYIGSTVWVDKGVKGLIPDGRNTDGSLKNIEFTTDKLLSSTTSGVNHSGMYITLSSKGSFMFHSKTTSTGDRYYDWNKNLVMNTGNDPRAILGEFQTDANKNIINYHSKLAFHAPDIQDVVRKTGDTMSGVLELYGTSSHLGLFGGSIFTHNMNISMDTAPSSNIYFPVVEHQDKDNVRKGRLESFYKTDGSHGFQITEANNGVYSAICAGFDANGNPYTYAPHCNITNGIVTQAGISKATNGYMKLGNGIILQWGVHSSGSGGDEYTITLPTAFSNTNYSVVGVSRGDKVSNSDYQVHFKITSKTQFKKTGQVATGLYWFAIGY